MTGNRGDRFRLRGPSRIDSSATPKRNPAASIPAMVSQAAQPAPAGSRAWPAKKRVLFVCIGNSCRSQIAEALARAYGSDVMDVQSAGVSPATMIASLTKQTLAERNLNIDGHFPKGMDIIRRQPFDLVVNMSGIPVALPGARVLQWTVQDPIGHKDTVYRAVANQLEDLVVRLIVDLRNGTL